MVKPWRCVDSGLHREGRESAVGAHRAALERGEGKEPVKRGAWQFQWVVPAVTEGLSHLGRASILEYYKLHFKEQLKSPGEQVFLSLPFCIPRYEVWSQNYVRSEVRSGLAPMLPEEI